MAFAKAILTWSRLRWILVICWLCLTLRVAIPDYPYGVPLWQSLVLDQNGFWHEAFYIAVGFLVLIDLTYHWEKKGQRVYLRVKRTE